MPWTAHKITYRIVKTGRVVTPAYAKAHPETTKKEHWRKPIGRMETLRASDGQHAVAAERREASSGFKRQASACEDRPRFLTSEPNDVVAHPKAMPGVILTTPEWMMAPAEQALKLQRPLPDGVLSIVATADRKDGDAGA